MCQPEVYWLSKQRILLFCGWQIQISKELFINSEYRYSDDYQPDFSPKLLDLSSNTLNLSNSFDILCGSVLDTGNNPSRSNPATSSSKRNTKTKLKGMLINCNGPKSLIPSS